MDVIEKDAPSDSEAEGSKKGKKMVSKGNKGKGKAKGHGPNGEWVDYGKTNKGKGKKGGKKGADGEDAYEKEPPLEELIEKNGYDPENIFAKILDGKIPSYQIFENKHVVAILDAFPSVEGHCLVVPKARGYKDFTEMPPRMVADVATALPIVAKALKEELGCEGVNMFANSGEAAGQTVFHPHFHLIPRYAAEGDNKLFKFPGPKDGMIKPEDANVVKERLVQRLANGPKPVLKKATFKSLEDLVPDSTGVNLRVRILTEPEEKGKGKSFEVEVELVS